MSKSIFRSRTFWTAVVGAVLDYSGALVVVGVPPGAISYVGWSAMIAMRVITKGAVHVVKDAASEP